MFKADLNLTSLYQNKLALLYLSLITLTTISGCSLLPPVQEMSNARQSIQAAKSANAQLYDNKGFSEAEALLERASKKIDLGEYAEARDLAIQARSKAIKSRQHAVLKSE